MIDFYIKDDKIFLNLWGQIFIIGNFAFIFLLILIICERELYILIVTLNQQVKLTQAYF